MKLSNGSSAASLRYVSRDLTVLQPSSNGISAVVSNGTSTVSQRLRYRRRLDFQLRLNLSGLIVQVRCTAQTRRPVRACGAALVPGGVRVIQKQGKELRGFRA